MCLPFACEPVVVPPAALERPTGYSLPTLPGWAELQAILAMAKPPDLQASLFVTFVFFVVKSAADFRPKETV